MSLIELTFAAGLLVTVSAIALPQLTAGLEELRARAAVRYVTSRLQKVRAEAANRSNHVAVRFTRDAEGYSFAVYTDGNGDGVRSADIHAGVDPRITDDERLPDHFPGVDFNALPGLPAADPSSSPPGNDPVRVGTSHILSFSPLGTATPGSLYVGSARQQYAVRVLGETGRTRVLRFDRARRTWSAWQ